MKHLWIAIAPTQHSTRVVAVSRCGETILEASFAPHPSHLRALPTLLDAVALWEGQKVHAALCAADRAGESDSSLYRAAFDESTGGPLYTLEWLPSRGAETHHTVHADSFAALRSFLLTAVAR